MQDTINAQAQQQMLAALAHYFGYKTFRPGQARVIASTLAGRDGVAVMPTGAGKSICYQLPAAMLPGVAVVVSPLISLMEDQVASLDSVGIPAACLTSHKLASEREDAMRAALDGRIKVLYVAPERLTDGAFESFLRRAQISLIAIDEAHCVSQWGQDFRQSYLQIGPFLATLDRRPPVLALTATATPRVCEDIITLLGLRDPTFTITTFDRPNLNLTVKKLTKARKTSRIIAHALARPDESGIVYCATRKEVERVTDELRAAGVDAAAYHAGLTPEARAKAQRAFIVDDVRVMVATSAFGMGIDKPDVRWVIHNNLTSSLEQYYQEAGRAGRDGAPADCLLLWNDGDFATLRFFIERDVEDDTYSAEQREAVRATQARMLSVMANYCLTGECLHDFILRYFGEKPPKRGGQGEGEGAAVAGIGGMSATGGQVADGVAATAEDAVASTAVRATVADEAASSSGCGMCSNCTENIKSVDVTEDARVVLRCVHALRGRYGKTVVADLCTGANNSRTRELKPRCEKSFGALKCSKDEALDLIEMLVARQLLSATAGDYPTLGLGPFWREAGEADFKVSIKGRGHKSGGGVGGQKSSGGIAGASGRKGPGSAKAGQSSSSFAGSEPKRHVRETNNELFEVLRDLRKKIADEEGKPPYVVCSDATLRDMCARRPVNDQELLEVHGIGPHKAARYGEVFLQAIKDFKC